MALLEVVVVREAVLAEGTLSPIEAQSNRAPNGEAAFIALSGWLHPGATS
jgi:hypothetical protein